MLNSASAAAFISGRSEGREPRAVRHRCEEGEKNGLHRAPLLKSPLGRGEEEGEMMGRRRGEEGWSGSPDAAGAVAEAAASAHTVRVLG